VLEDIIGKLSQMVAFVRSQTLSKGDHFAIRAVEAVDATGSAVANMDKVILAVKIDNGTIFEFALDPRLSERLRKETLEAEEAIKKRPSHARH
jgi:hypothetical protein